VKEKFKDTKGVIKSRKSMAEKIQWRNENREKDKQCSTKYYTQNYRLSITKTRGELRFSGRVNSPCKTDLSVFGPQF
jgi:hypothetical protein